MYTASADGHKITAENCLALPEGNSKEKVDIVILESEFGSDDAWGGQPCGHEMVPDEQGCRKQRKIGKWTTCCRFRKIQGTGVQEVM